jgi:hypothetical protein
MLQLRPTCECCNTDLPPPAATLADDPPSSESVYKPAGCAAVAARSI